jgi:hypothetical protein
MKNIFIVFFMLSLVSCGNNVRKMIGADYDEKIKKQDVRIKKLEEQVASIKDSISKNKEEMITLSSELIELEDMVFQGHTAFETAIKDIRLEILELETQTANLLLQLSALEGKTITEIIDPCGNSAGFDEVLLKTGDGKVLAYFESGSNRFLGLLSAGNYRTTDGTKCNFAVSSSGMVSW